MALKRQINLNRTVGNSTY